MTITVLAPSFGQRPQRSHVIAKLAVLGVSIGHSTRTPSEITFVFERRQICHNIYVQLKQLFIIIRILLMQLLNGYSH